MKGCYMIRSRAICGCPGLLYLNTSQQAMSVLNLGLANLAARADLTADEYILTEVLAGISSVITVRSAIYQYDIELLKAIAVLKHR